jgi:hypothetical protein
MTYKTDQINQCLRAPYFVVALGAQDGDGRQVPALPRKRMAGAPVNHTVLPGEVQDGTLKLRVRISKGARS